MLPDADNGRPAADFVTRHLWLFTCLLCVVWMLPGLLGRDPWKPDEAVSLGLVYHILQSGDWVVPSLAHEPLLERPPLFYLTAALFARGFGWLLPMHDAARLVNVLYLGLAFLFIGLTSKELYTADKAKPDAVGCIGVLTLLGCAGMLDRAHLMIPDIALLSGCAIAVYGLALAARCPILGGAWLGVGTGIGFMSKGLFAPAVFAATSLFLPALFAQWRERRYLLTLAVAIGAALPWLLVWPAALYHRSPVLFHEWLWANNLERFTIADWGMPGRPGYYFGVLSWFAFPAWAIALWTLWVRNRELRSSVALHLPLVVFLVSFIAVSLSHPAREVNALPLLPGLALLAVPGLPLLRRGAANALWWFALMVFCFFALAGWFYWVALDLSFPARLHAHLMRLRPAYEPGWQLLKLAIAACTTAAWIYLIPRLPRSPYRAMTAWAGALALLWAFGAVLFIPWIDSANSYRSMMWAIRDAMPSSYRCMWSHNLGEPQRALLQYFAGIVSYREAEAGRKRDCDVLLVQGLRKNMYAPAQGELIWQGARPGDNNELYRLYRKSPTR